MAGLRLASVIIVGALAFVGAFPIDAANAEIKKRTILYRQGDTELEGYLAYEEVGMSRRPGVLIGHTWAGIGQFIQGRAEAYARLGYVAFVPDIFGKDGRPQQPPQPTPPPQLQQPPRPPGPPAATTETKKYIDDRDLLRARARAGLDILRAQATVDPDQLLAVGYGFGGAMVLELARFGADLKGVVTFHGLLNNPTPAQAEKIRGRVLVLHGADDTVVRATEIEAFEKEMKDASAAVKARTQNQRSIDWQLVTYGNATHSFTEPTANSNETVSNDLANRRSWIAMQIFFNDILGSATKPLDRAP
jgi:dienelactone hydrolase